MLIFPAIDLLGGRCVRLTEGAYDTVKAYSEDPVEVARRFEAEGATWLHVVDLDAARSGEASNWSVVERICTETGLRVELGGGVRSLDLARAALRLGVERVVAGTVLAHDPELAKSLFEELKQFVVAGIDTRDGRVAAQGWTETSDLEGLAFARELERAGCRRVIFTDIARDGKLTGPNVEANRQMAKGLAIPVVASGGVSTLDDLDALAPTGVEGVIVGKALYEGRFTLPEALERAKSLSAGPDPVH